MSAEQEDMSNYKFLFKTVQASAIRTLIEALKEILTDVNFEINESGIKVIAMDSSHVSLIYMKLLSENFEKFYCEKPIVCGISIVRLFKYSKF